MDPSVLPPSGAEQTPVSPSKPEQAPAVGSPEAAPHERKVEKREAGGEQMRPSQGVSLPPVQPPPAAAVPAVAQPAVAADDDGKTPVIADDVDVIEMEWVNQAKKVIKETKDDPHAQELAVEKLQKQYLKKRFGREIKSSSA